MENEGQRSAVFRTRGEGEGGRGLEFGVGVGVTARCVGVDEPRG